MLQTSSMISDSLNVLSKANFSGITNLANRQTDSNIRYLRSANESFESGGLVSNMDSANSRSSLDMQSNLSPVFSSVSKRFGAWLGLVRESLAAAVTGATALDAMDVFAQQQLQQDQYLLVQNKRGNNVENVNQEAVLRGSYVLVQSSTGRDRALVVAGLIQVILNPEVRTVKG